MLFQCKHGSDERISQESSLTFKLLKEGLSTRIVAKQVGYSQSAIAKIWIKYKHTRIHSKEKCKGRPKKTSKRDDLKLKVTLPPEPQIYFNSNENKMG